MTNKKSHMRVRLIIKIDHLGWPGPAIR